MSKASFSQNGSDPTCQLCHKADETITHFLLNCPVLESSRRPATESILHIARYIAVPYRSYSVQPKWN